MHGLFAFGALSLLVASSAPITYGQWVGIDRRVANSFAVAQVHSEWCWAASSQLVLRLNGIETTQSAIVPRVHGNLQNMLGSDHDVTSALNTSSDRRVATAFEHAGFSSSEILLQELSAPILIEFMTGPSAGHVVVITSLAVTQTASGPFIAAIALRDPRPSPANIMNSGRVQIDNFNKETYTKDLQDCKDTLAE
jgi:Papain-like cysteine protease AvrRpt2